MDFLNQQKSLFATILLFIFGGICLFICFTETGAGLHGDSIGHYLIAKYAYLDTILYFNHWGKPLFTLLASPFTFFGFTGIKIFNLLLAFVASFFTYRTALLLKLKNSPLTILFIFGGTLFFINIFSGLTEYLSAAMLITGIYLEVKNKTTLAAILISFTPFVRSEGLILVGIFAIYYVLHKKYRSILYLTVGHLIYSVVGYFWYHEILWVFTKIPYARISSVYGQGNYFHFVDQLMFMLGVPIYIFLLIGVLKYCFDFIKAKSKLNYFRSEQSILIYGIGIGFFIAHTLFWALGIFNSMGLNRVFITVIPVFSLIALVGFNSLVCLTRVKKARVFTFILLILYTIIFPFTSNKSSIKDDYSSLQLKPLYHRFETEIRTKINFETYDLFYFSDPYYAYSLNINFNDPNQRIAIPSDKDSLILKKVNSLVIWDNWYSPIENNSNIERLRTDQILNRIYEHKNSDNEIDLAIFELKM